MAAKSATQSIVSIVSGRPSCVATPLESYAARTWHRNEQGATLIGELLALAIIGVALLVLLAGLSTSSLGVAVVEQRVSAENYARLQMEAIKAGPYHPDPGTDPYPLVDTQGIYTLSVDVHHWDADAATFADEPSEPDSGLQRIRIRVYSSQRPGAPVFVLEDYKGNRS